MKIIVTHGYSDSNKGDVAIAQGTIAALSAAAPDASIRFHSIYREDHTAFAHHNRASIAAGIPVIEGVLPSPYLNDNEAFPLGHITAMLRLLAGVMGLLIAWLGIGKGRQRAALHEIRDADLIIARGSQYLHNDAGPVRGILYLWRMLMNLAVPIWLGKPVVILGMSIGPLHGTLARWMTARVLRHCRMIVVRERHSADLLAGLGIKGQVRIAPDLAFLTKPMMHIEAPPEGRYIGVTLMHWTFPGHANPKAAQECYLNAVAGALELAYQQLGLIPLLCAQVTTRHHGIDDEPALGEIKRRLHAAGVPFVEVLDDASPEQLAALYGCCEVVLATRLHSLIFAACAGTPAVAIRYQGYKTQGIMELLGVADYVCDIASIDAASLFAAISSAVQHRDALSAHLRQRVAAFQQEVHEAAREAIACAGRNSS